MRVMIADEHVLGSPYKVIVNATSAKAEASRLVSGRFLRGRVDQPAMVTIQAYDRFGNRLGAQGSSEFVGNFPQDHAVLLSIPQAELVGAGKYNVSFIVTKAGTYQAIITLDSVQIGGSPVTVEIVSGYTDALTYCPTFN